MPSTWHSRGPASNTAGSSSKNTSRHAGKVTEGKSAGGVLSKDSLESRASESTKEPPKPNMGEDLLKALRSDFDSLRNLVTCKICDRLLYEPYVISCGHTYCYSCLCTWFVSNKAKKTCPDCRTLVTQAPAPAYLIREMALVFLNRAELLPPGETLEQHAQWQKEESEIVLQDKSKTDGKTGGLFKGCFKDRAKLPLHVIRDEEDGVDRCPLCMYELEDGACIRCELQFDESGSATWGESFGGFSDMDESSEYGDSREDLDAELDMEDRDANFGLDDYGDGAYDDWHDDMADVEQSFAVRRWLENGGTARPPPGFGTGPRRRAAHSAAGSRRRSYTASLVSGTPEDSEMGTLDEEDDDMDDEDSSMNDFIDDGEDSEVASQSSASTPVGIHHPQSSRTLQRRPRRVVESDTSSAISADTDDEEDDEEGPLPSGRRRHQALSQRASRGHQRASVGPSVSTDTATSEQDFDEENTQALLYQAGYSPLGHQGSDEMEEDDDDDESDGESTTVGWEPTAISNERFRITGSLTPRADRPFVDIHIRPSSRAGDAHPLDGSRGLRQRTSQRSTVFTVNYEHGEADDDDMEMEMDGGINLDGASLRNRSSRVRLRGNAVPTRNPMPSTNRGLSLGDAIGAGTNDADDVSARPRRHRQRTLSRQHVYNPRISWMFAQHQSDISEMGLSRNAMLYDHLEELRGSTPFSRPRTANRNRISAQTRSSASLSPHSAEPLAALSPAHVPARVRTPSVGSASLNRALSSTHTQSEGSVTHLSTSSVSERAGLSNVVSGARGASLDSGESGSSSTASLTGPHSSINVYNSSRHSLAMSPGLNVAARFQPPGSRNPFLEPMTAYARPQQRGQQVRERSSTATLRSDLSQRDLRQRSSRTSVGNDLFQPSNASAQTSRVDLHSQPSPGGMRSRASSRTLQAHDAAPSSPQPTPSRASTYTSPGFTAENQQQRAAELVQRRAQMLGTNPFSAGTRPEGPASGTSGLRSRQSQAQVGGHETMDTDVPSSDASGTSVVSVSIAPSRAAAIATASGISRGLPRQRSGRNIAALPSTNVFA